MDIVGDCSTSLSIFLLLLAITNMKLASHITLGYNFIHVIRKLKCQTQLTPAVGAAFEDREANQFQSRTPLCEFGQQSVSLCPGAMFHEMSDECEP